MDPAHVVHNALLDLQKPINEIIDRGDSNIQQFYRDSSVFITGASGFLGRALLEKILRSCQLKKAYVLLRPKKGKNIQDRLDNILSDPLYDTLRTKNPQFADTIVPVEGDVADIRLGLRDEDWNLLTREVNFIFHMAATVRFDEPIKVATIINIRGTREALKLARECKNFICFNHCSTAFAHTTADRIDTDVQEKFYPSPVPPDVMIKMVENMKEDTLKAITPELINNWPNTYTFTKAITEELIRNTTDIPICIVKPPVVFPSYVEPAPGWVEYNTCFSSPLGAVLATGLGILHTVHTRRDRVTLYAPVDFVNNAVLAASWDTIEQRKKGVEAVNIYTVGNAEKHGITWGHCLDLFKTDEVLRLVSPKAVWYTCGIATSNVIIFWLLTWLFHYIPGYVIDALLDITGKRPKGIPRLVNTYSRMYKLTMVYKYFLFNMWYVKDDNCQAMVQRMSEADRIIFNCNLNELDKDLFIKCWCIGVRKYILKDGLKDSIVAYNRQQYFFRFLNAIVVTLYAYLIYYVLCKFFAISLAVINFVF